MIRLIHVSRDKILTGNILRRIAAKILTHARLNVGTGIVTVQAFTASGSKLTLAHVLSYKQTLFSDICQMTAAGWRMEHAQMRRNERVRIYETDR
jgi:hypothetical protein